MCVCILDCDRSRQKPMMFNVRPAPLFACVGGCPGGFGWLVLWLLFVNLTQIRILWGETAQLRKKPRSYWPVGKSAGNFLDAWPPWRHPWTSGPRWYTEANWESKDTRQCALLSHGLSFSSCVQVPASSSCPGFPQQGSQKMPKRDRL